MPIICSLGRASAQQPCALPIPRADIVRSGTLALVRSASNRPIVLSAPAQREDAVLRMLVVYASRLCYVLSPLFSVASSHATVYAASNVGSFGILRTSKCCCCCCCCRCCCCCSCVILAVLPTADMAADFLDKSPTSMTLLPVVFHSVFLFLFKLIFAACRFRPPLGLIPIDENEALVSGMGLGFASVYFAAATALNRATVDVNGLGYSQCSVPLSFIALGLLNACSLSLVPLQLRLLYEGLYRRLPVPIILSCGLQFVPPALSAVARFVPFGCYVSAAAAVGASAAGLVCVTKAGSPALRWASGHGALSPPGGITAVESAAPLSIGGDPSRGLTSSDPVVETVRYYALARQGAGDNQQLLQRRNRASDAGATSPREPGVAAAPAVDVTPRRGGAQAATSRNGDDSLQSSAPRGEWEMSYMPSSDR
eukprot:GHVU01140090.1.p1 GENE.GHVU01140090.1~~GHVU01140090.1.p1  ORF type:complete len:426 (+),score=19.91 GHVU01140090.1:4050-5327(+)